MKPRKLHLLPAAKLVWQCNPRLAVATTLVMFFQGVLPVVPIYAVKLIVDGIQTGQPFRHVAVLVGVAGAAMLLNAALQSLGGFIREAQGRALTDYVQDAIHKKSLQLSMTYYEGPDFFDKLHRAQEEAPYRPRQVIDNLMILVRASISLAGIVGVLVYSLPWYTVVILAVSAMPLGIIRLMSARRFYRWSRRRTPDQRRVYYLNWLLTDRPAAKDIRVFELGKLISRRSRRLRTRLRREYLAIVRTRSVLELVASGLQSVAIVGLLIYLTYQGVNGGTTLGNIVLFFQSIQKGQQILSEMLGGSAALYETNLFLSTVFEFFSLEPDLEFPSRGRATTDLGRGVEIDRVSFHYPNSDHLVVNEVSMTIAPGEIVALVGDNGAGKTTLIKLLCRFYDPASGVIRVDGHDLSELSQERLRSLTSVLFQDIVSYHDSARDNVWFGDVSQMPDDQRVVAASKAALADEFLSTLPQGYRTRLGRWIEEGSELSGGQWKRVALARALYRDAPLLILDEPTAGVDPDAETRFVDSLRALAKDRCMLLVSHRVAPVRQADKVYVMRDGSIVEHGTHDELLAANGYYATMFNTQMRQIRDGAGS
jgi:ATP-binding cassette subfamily B protein